MTQTPAVRILDRLARLTLPDDPSGRTCEAEGCLAMTRHRKPMCSEHWHLMPYAAKVHQTWEQIEQDYARLRAGGEVTEAIAEDMLASVIDACSLGQLARLHSVTPDDAKRVMQYLAKQHRVRFVGRASVRYGILLLVERIDGDGC